MKLVINEITSSISGRILVNKSDRSRKIRFLDKIRDIYTNIVFTNWRIKITLLRFVHNEQTTVHEY